MREAVCSDLIGCIDCYGPVIVNVVGGMQLSTTIKRTIHLCMVLQPLLVTSI